VSVVLIGVIVASLTFAKSSFLLVVAMAILVGLWEIGRALAGNGTWLPMAPMSAGALGMIGGSYYGGADVLIVVLAATVLFRGTPARSGRRRQEGTELCCGHRGR
jgi:phosphatidate cytidylyltransferase